VHINACLTTFHEKKLQALTEALLCWLSK